MHSNSNWPNIFIKEFMPLWKKNSSLESILMNECLISDNTSKDMIPKQRKWKLYAFFPLLALKKPKNILKQKVKSCCWIPCSSQQQGKSQHLSWARKIVMLIYIFIWWHEISIDKHVLTILTNYIEKALSLLKSFDDNQSFHILIWDFILNFKPLIKIDWFFWFSCQDFFQLRFPCWCSNEPLDNDIEIIAMW